MENNKLVSMVEYINLEAANSKFNSFSRIVDYANFLSRPLTLGMFVPCDLRGNVLARPEKPLSPATDEEWDKWSKEVEPYLKARESVLFIDFQLENPEKHGIDTLEYSSFIKHASNGNVVAMKKQEENWELYFKSIEQLLIDFDLTLTASALKQINQ